jgi:hypothetical protein
MESKARGDQLAGIIKKLREEEVSASLSAVALGMHRIIVVAPDKTGYARAFRATRSYH